MEFEVSTPAEFTERFINQTNRSIFLTGKAGTGKTTLLKKIISSTFKKTVVAAPTGIAALNAGGITIHSLFQLPFGTFIPDYLNQNELPDNLKLNSKSTLNNHIKMGADKKRLIRNLELLIIDEVSMLRADLLDAIDFTLKNIRKNDDPFGGLQILFIGDLLQLPPVVKNQEREYLNQYYNGYFFFNSKVIEEENPIYIELEKIYRQSDEKFIEILNNFRNNNISRENIIELNKRYNPNSIDNSAITITTHNRLADDINLNKLNSIKNKTYKYKSEINGIFPENIYPLPETIELKVDTQVMFIKNDPSFEKKYYNGKIGTIKSLTKDKVLVEFQETNEIIDVEKYEWENIKFSLNQDTNEIEEEVVGSFVQYPLKLAWAITVHKSQGLTFDKAKIDISKVFTAGHAYVALSRLRSLEGLILINPVADNQFRTDYQITEYAKNKLSENNLKTQLNYDTIIYIQQLLIDSFNWDSFVNKWLANSNILLKNYKNIFIKYVDNLKQTLEPLRKFRNLILKITKNDNFNINHVTERSSAAHDYFIERLETSLKDNIYFILSISRETSNKKTMNLLTLFDEELTDKIINIKKTISIINNIKENNILDKNNSNFSELNNYKINIIEKVKDKFIQENPNIGEFNYDKIIKRNTLDDDKPIKKISTFEKTKVLLKKGKTAYEIAENRKLSESTIYSHFAKLLENNEVELNEVLNDLAISELDKIFAGNSLTNLTDMKKLAGDDFSWDELRLYKLDNS
jgi:hypothetical protein